MHKPFKAGCQNEQSRESIPRSLTGLVNRPFNFSIILLTGSVSVGQVNNTKECPFKEKEAEECTNQFKAGCQNEQSRS